MNTESVDFHGKVVLDRGEQGCKKCHGDDFNGGLSDVSCVECHLTSGVCASCHGGVVDNSGAPPKGLHGETETSSLAVGAHTSHMHSELGKSVVCNNCHIVPASILDSTHLDVGTTPLDSIAEITFSGLAANPQAEWNRDSATCKNIYCHGNFENGNKDNAPVWTGVNQADCGTCHPVAHNMSDYHSKHQLYLGPAGLVCGNCHAAEIDTLFQFTNKDLHINGVVDTLTRDPALCADCHTTGPDQCIRCHGGQDNQTGAPPTGLNGETSTSDLAVGAHSAHVQNNQFTDAFDCDICHIKPAVVLDTIHLDGDGIAEMTFNQLAGDSVKWDRNTATCNYVYCHGDFEGGLHANPIWTGTDQALCGSCHDVGDNPGSIDAIHDFHVGTAGIRCATCHSTVVDIQKNIIGLDLHVNGQVDTSVTNQALCNSCHLGEAPDCTGCHGGYDNQTGAPPYGLEGETATTTLAVGAHTAHIEGKTMSDGIPCSSCHIIPDAILDFGHLEADQTAEVTFDALAGSSSLWDRASATCSQVYCHGNFNGGYASNQPNWTMQNQAECGSCHDVNGNLFTMSGQHNRHVIEKNIDCYRCHDATVDASRNIIGLDVHVNGSVEVVFSSGQGTFDGTNCSNVGCHGTKSWGG